MRFPIDSGMRVTSGVQSPGTTAFREPAGIAGENSARLEVIDDQNGYWHFVILSPSKTEPWSQSQPRKRVQSTGFAILPIHPHTVGEVAGTWHV